MSRAAVALLSCAALAGCATQSIPVKAPDLGSPLVTALPLRVGVRIDPQVRNYAYEPVSGIKYVIGPAVSSAMAVTTRAGFDQAEDLSDGEVARTGAVDAIVELSRLDFWQGTNVLGAGFEFQLLAPDGRTISTWQTSQTVALRFDVHNIFGPHSDPHEVAINQAMAAFLRDFRDDPAVREWLQAHGAYRPAMPVALSPADSVETPSTDSGIYVLSDADSVAVRDCVIDGLRDRLGDKAVVTDDAVRRALFPWLTDAPPLVAAERLSALSRYRLARDRLAALNIGRFVLVAGGTTQDWHGGILCGGGYGGGGCLGLSWGDRRSVIAARLLVVGTPPDATESRVVHEGKALVPALGLPLPFIPATQSEACSEISSAIAKRLKVPVSGDSRAPR